METRKTRRTHGIDREENPDDSGPLVAGGEEEDLPTLQDPSTAPAEQPGTDAGLREAHSRLAELLLAAASILAEISSSGGAGTVGDILQGRPADSRQNEWGIPAIAPGPTFGGNGERHVVVGSQARASTSSAREGVRHFTSAAGAAILHTDGEAERNHEADDFIFQQRLPTLSAFKAEGGDWGQFQRRFLAHQEMSAWSDATALRALPAMLNDDALAAFRAARKSDRSTLKDALGLLARVYGPPSACRHHFYARRKAATETALAYRTALLALADAAFPRMDEEGQDAMVLEQLLKLAQDLGVPINTADEIDISSLRVATSIQAHEALQRKQGVGCNAAVVAAPGWVVAEPQVVSPREEAFATGRPGDWRPGARSPLRSGRKSEQPRSTPTLVTCYNCGLRGHVASGCRAPRQRAMGARLDDDREPKSSLQSPASRGTSHARPVYSAHMGRRVAAEEGWLRDPFVMVLNAGSRPAVIPQGTVLAHAARVPVDDGLVAQVGSSPARNVEPREDLEWVHSLCAASDDLSAAQLGALRELLIEFSDVFSKHKYDIGCTDLLHHYIETGDAAPGRDSLLSLSLSEWGRLQMADSSLLALRRKVGGPEGDQERTGSYVLEQGMLLRWDSLSRRNALVVPSASAAAVTDAFVQGYVLDKGAPERLLTDQGVSELTAADHRRPDLRGGAGPFRPVPRRLEQPEPPDGRQCPAPYDGPARRTRARSCYFA
ncbi:unnamed protein product [Lampetra planeri]